MTDIDLREFLEGKIQELDGRVNTRFLALEEQAKGRRDRRAEALAILGLILWLATIAVMIWQGRN